MSAALTVAIAMFVGIATQAVARRLRVPGIVALLAVGVLLGPDVAGLVEPDRLGAALHAVVGFGVAVILFEGGLNVDIRRLRAEATVIRRLVLLGALITAVGGAAAAHLILGWDWRMALLFGTLVVVTGPTVINPLLRRFKVNHSVETILEAEGVFIDAFGAFVAVAGLQIALSPSAGTAGEAVLGFAGRIGIGSAIGAAGAALLLLLWRLRALPRDLENVFALGAAILVFEASNSILRESGIAAVVAAGMIVGNSRQRNVDQLAEFKEQLTQLLIAVLFVLLAADVRLADVYALGWGGVAVVAALMLIVRPVNVGICSLGTSLSLRERGFLSWLAPRGIVAAAVASWFAHELTAAGIDGGDQVRALVFLVIAATVTIQGSTAGLVARLLAVQRPARSGYAIFGANALARALGRALAEDGEEVVMIDSNRKQSRLAKEAGFCVYRGNALRERLLDRARVGDRIGCIGCTTNEEANYIFVQAIERGHRGARLAAAVTEGKVGVTTEMVRDTDAGVLFGRPADVAAWCSRLADDEARIEAWRWRDDSSEPPDLAGVPDGLLPMVVCRDGELAAVDDRTELEEGDVVQLAIADGAAEARGWLRENRFDPLTDDEPDQRASA